MIVVVSLSLQFASFCYWLVLCAALGCLCLGNFFFVCVLCLQLNFRVFSCFLCVWWMFVSWLLDWLCCLFSVWFVFGVYC